MYYQQAGLFVAWLHKQSNAKFRKLLASLQSGMEFERSVLNAYGFGVMYNWDKFKSDIKT